MAKQDFCIYRILLIFITCLIVVNVFGQAEKIKTRKIVLREPEVNNQNQRNFNRFAIKVNPLLIAIGDIPVSLEYAVADWFSAEAALGFTFENHMDGVLDHWEYNNNVDEDHKVIPGLSYMFNIKIIPSTDIYDDASYIALQINNRTYRQEYTFTDKQVLTGSGVLQSERHIRDYGIAYGYYYLTEIDNIFLEYYIGVTIRKVEGIRIEQEYNSTTQSYFYVPDAYSYNTIGGLLGFKIGYNFDFW